MERKIKEASSNFPAWSCLPELTVATWWHYALKNKTRDSGVLGQASSWWLEGIQKGITMAFNKWANGRPYNPCGWRCKRSSRFLENLYNDGVARKASTGRVHQFYWKGYLRGKPPTAPRLCQIRQWTKDCQLLLRPMP